MASKCYYTLLLGIKIFEIDFFNVWQIEGKYRKWTYLWASGQTFGIGPLNAPEDIHKTLRKPKPHLNQKTDF